MFVAGVLADCLFGGGVEGGGEDCEEAEDAGGVGGEAGVAEAEGGFDADVYAFGAEEFEAAALVAELFGVVGGAQVNGHGEQAPGGADGEREVAARVTDLVGNVGGDVRRDACQEFARLGRLQLFEREALHAGERDRFAGSDHQGRAGRGHEGAHLRAVAGVVEEEEGAYALEGRAVEAREFSEVVGEFLFYADEGADAGREGVRGVAGRVVGAAHVYDELGVGVGVAELVGDVEGEFGLADAAHAADAADGGARAAAERRGQ